MPASATNEIGIVVYPGVQTAPGADHERARLQLGEGCKDLVKVALAGGMQDMEPQPKPAGRDLRVSRGGLRSSRTVWVDEEGNDGRRRDHLVQ